MELFLINRLILGNRLDAIDKQRGPFSVLAHPAGPTATAVGVSLCPLSLGLSSHFVEC